MLRNRSSTDSILDVRFICQCSHYVAIVAITSQTKNCIITTPIYYKEQCGHCVLLCSPPFDLWIILRGFISIIHAIIPYNPLLSNSDIFALCICVNKL